MLPEISSAMLVVTHRCNLECRYCFVKQKDEDMDIETAREAARFLAGNARRAGTAPAINFFGGEPMLRWEGLLRPLAREIRAEGRPFRLSVTTNGTLLTEERMEEMQRLGFGLLLSMDGARGVQDANRPFHGGGGSFERLERVIPGALRRWPGVTLRMTAAPWSCGGLFESIRWAEGMGFRSFFVIPDVFSRWDGGSWGALEREVMRYAGYVRSRREAGHAYIRFSALEGALDDADKLRTPEGRASLGRARPGREQVRPGGREVRLHRARRGIYACQEMCSNAGPESPFYIGFAGRGRQRGEAARADGGVFQRAAARGGRLRRLPL